MKKVKATFKKLLIIYLIIYIAISSMSSCFARQYDDACGEYVSQYARDFIAQYCTPTNEKTQYVGIAEPRWTGGSFGQGKFQACCTAGVKYMYELALGVNIYDLGFNAQCATAIPQMSSSPNWTRITSASELKPGDIVISGSHTEMYIGNNENANFGNDPYAGKIAFGPRLGSSFTHAFRPNFDVNPSGTVPGGGSSGDLEEESLSIYDENGFIYSGVAEVDGYKGSEPFLKWIFNKITEILDYLIGIITYAIRAVIVGWTAIIERLVIDGIVNAVTGVTDERVDNWEKDPATQDEVDRSLLNEVEDDITRSQPTSNPGDPDYISAGVQGIADIGGSIQLNTSSRANVTVENIVYNKIPILDINFFNIHDAGGAVIEEDGVIYTIKSSIATWYYVFRVIAMVIMLLVLIYLGVRLSFTSVAEKKAVYKDMLLSWLAGFILVFIMNYIMYAVISVNESFVSWVIPRYESGAEISLYESVRSKAYELKASTGFTGMIMYIILVYYAIRFLLVYFKRFLTIMILAIMSPFVAITYALEKINKSGRAPGEIFGNWLKDFTYTVLLQSIHALIYTSFISIILKLTEVSLLGIFLAFMFLSFLIKADGILRKVFGFDSNKNVNKLTVDPLAPKIAMAAEIGKGAKKIAGVYGNKLARPAMNKAGQMTRKAQEEINRARRTIEERVTGEKIDKDEWEQKQEERKRQKEEERRKRKKRSGNTLDKAVTGLMLGKNVAAAVLKGATVLPIAIVEPGLGMQILSSTLNSSEKVKKTLKKARKKGYIPRTAKQGKRFTLKGIRPKNEKSAQNLRNKLHKKGYILRFVQEGRQTHFGKNMGSTFKRRTKVNISNLKLATSGKDVEEFLGTEDEIRIYKEVLRNAQEKESEILSDYKDVLNEIDKKISATEGLDPEFARKLKEKQSEEFLKNAKDLSKPISAADIYKAIENYKTKVPTFNNNNLDELTRSDIQGIAGEIDNVLESKSSTTRMSKEFVKKLEMELEKRRSEDKQNSEKSSMGEDLTGKDSRRTVKENIHDIGQDRNTGGEYAFRTQNAQKQNNTGDRTDSHNIEKNMSIEKLVENIQNASKGTESKETNLLPKSSIYFAQKLDQLEKLNSQAEEITSEKIYDIDDVIERLKNIQ